MRVLVSAVADCTQYGERYTCTGADVADRSDLKFTANGIERFTDKLLQCSFGDKGVTACDRRTMNLLACTDRSSRQLFGKVFVCLNLNDI